MRTLCVCVFLMALGAGHLAAQSPAAAGGAEGAVTIHALRREDSSKTWLGAGVGGAWNGSRLGLAAEATITRRDGHNDWHALAGPRVTLVSHSRSRVFLQLLAGAVIRQKEARFSGQIGGGVDVNLNDRTALRVLLAGVRDQTAGEALASGRLSIGVVIR